MPTAEDLAQISATIAAKQADLAATEAEIMALNLQYVECYLQVYGMGGEAMTALATELKTCVAILQDSKAKG